MLANVFEKLRDMGYSHWKNCGTNPAFMISTRTCCATFCCPCTFCRRRQNVQDVARALAHFDADDTVSQHTPLAYIKVCVCVGGGGGKGGILPPPPRQRCKTKSRIVGPVLDTSSVYLFNKQY